MTNGEGFLDRLLRIVRQKMTARANQLDDPAEALDVAIGEHLAAINRARADLALVATSQKRLESAFDDLRAKSQRHIADARAAQASGNDATARTAMSRAIVSEQLANDAKQHIDDVVRRRGELERLLEEMRAYYELLKLRREAVNATANASRAMVEGQESLTPLSPEGRQRERDLERVHAMLADLRARADAVGELRASGTLDNVGASEFDRKALPSDDEVEQRLRELNP